MAHAGPVKRSALALALTGAAGALVSAGDGQRPQGPVYRATTNYISTDVKVQDANGQFVPDLGIAKYELSGSNMAVSLAKVDTDVPTQDCTP